MKIRPIGPTAGLPSAPKVASSQHVYEQAGSLLEKGSQMVFADRREEQARIDNQYKQDVANAAEYNVRKAKFDADKALFDSNDELSSYAKENEGKEYFSYHEVPEGVDVPLTEQVVNPQSGLIETRTRDRIPSYEVWPQMYEQRAKQIGKAHSSRLGSTATRTGYESRFKELASNQHRRYVSKSNSVQMAQMRDQAAADVNKSILNENWEQATIQAANFPGTDTEREAELRKVRKSKETYGYNNAMSSDDLPAMKQSLAYLQQKQKATVEGELVVVDSLPRGIRNNNPGNIEEGNIPWKGKLDNSTDERFAQFSTPADGIRAMGRILNTYESKHNLNTVAGIIGRWSPVDDPTNEAGSTDNYVNAVAEEVGVSPDEPLTAAHKAKLMASMIKHENGGVTWTPDEVATALAGGDVKGGSQLATETKPAADKYPGELNERERLTYVKALKSSMGQLEVKRKSTVTANENLLVRDINTTIEMIGNGEAVSPRALTQLQNKTTLATRHNPNKMAIHQTKLNETVDLMPKVYAMSTQPKIVRDMALDMLNKKEGLTPLQYRQKAALTKASENTEKRVNSDTISYAADIGIIDLMPMDFSTPQSTAAFFESRKMAYEKTMDTYGKSTGYLTDGEAQQFVAQMDKSGGVEAKSALVSMVHNNLGEDSVLFWEQLKDKNAGSYAIAGQVHAEGAPTVTSSILRGKAFRKENPMVIQNYKLDFYPEIVDQLGGAYTNQPKMLSATIEAIMDVYADKSSSQGDISGNMDDDRLEESINEVTGGLLEIGSTKIEPPVRGMSMEAFDTYIRDINGGWFDSKGGVGGYVGNYGELKDSMRNGDVQLISVGKNNYALYHNATNAFLSKRIDSSEPFMFSYDPKATVTMDWTDANSFNAGEPREMEAQVLLKRLKL